MSDRIFVDTNVLVYAHDVDAGKKHLAAGELVSSLWETQAGIFSTQVLQEFIVGLYLVLRMVVRRDSRAP